MQDVPPDVATNEAKVTFPVVGIGASSGGLEACSALLGHLLAPTGMAFVVVQHLDPHHESHLVDLLARVSPLPVCEARNGLAVQPDNVYVIAPNTSLTLRDGVLHTEPREDGHVMPVDTFLKSLAAELSERAIGVILSGTGSDGTLGVQTITESGGICFAQDDSATFPGMPNSAIASGGVQFVQAPDLIGRALSQHIGLARGLADEDVLSAGDEDLLRQLFGRLKRVTSAAYSQYKRSTILRRVRRRVAQLRLDSLESYLLYVDQHPAELDKLHQELLIHVTKFFRDADVFESLAASGLPDLVRSHQADDPIRLWVPGCSTGEEVYSLAICLKETLSKLAAPPDIKIFATDLSEAALETARAGRYPASISEDVSPPRLRNYFVRVDSGYQIIKEIRDRCVFARHDITSDPPFSNLDLISCRNVLIYLTPALQRRLLPIFHFGLKDDGLLVLGGAETIGTLTDLFIPLDARKRIYSRKPTVRRPLSGATFGFSSFSPVATNHGTSRSLPARIDFQHEADRALMSRYVPPGVLVSAELEILQTRGDVSPFLSLAPGTASLNLLKMAREGLLLELRTAVETCRQSGAPSRRRGIRVEQIGGTLDVQVVPVGSNGERGYWVLFETTELSRDEGVPPNRAVASTSEAAQPPDTANEVAALRDELAGMRGYLQSVIEQLESSNEALSVTHEEVLASNEELQSTNEELQTASEELQATNEELSTVNDELQNRMRQVDQLNDDLTLLFSNVKLPIVLVGPELEVRRFTPAAGSLFNLIAGDIGRPITAIKSHLVGVDLEMCVNSVLQSLVPIDHEIKDDTGLIHLLSIYPYHTRDNRIDGAVICVMNIDAMKRVEAATLAARDAATDIISTLDVPLLVLDEQMRVEAVNAAFNECFGTSTSRLAHRPLEDLTELPWLTATTVQSLRVVLVSGAPVSGVELRPTTSSASRTFLLGACRMKQDERRPVRVLVRIEDISHQRELELQLQQSQRMESVGNLAAGVAHDFNNLLTIILGYTRLLNGRLASDAESCEMLAAITLAADRASAVTRQLLAFSRKSMLLPKVVDLGKLLPETASELLRLLGEDIRLQIHCAPDLGAVFIDPMSLNQTLLNLASNARDSMPQGGELHLSASNCDLTDTTDPRRHDLPPGEYVEICLTDTGVGIAEETLKYVFEPFFTTKEVGKGTGLGLASAYGGIKQSGGHIYVDSQLGKGTTFRIYLPRTAMPSTVPSPNDVALEAMPRGAEVILLVEDDADVRYLACEILCGCGYTVLEAEDGVAAIAISRDHAGRIDLLLTDVVMPQMGGTELAHVLQAERPGLGLLFVSGYNDETLIRSGVDLAAAALLLKPYSNVALAQRVRSLLDSKKAVSASQVSH